MKMTLVSIATAIVLLASVSACTPSIRDTKLTGQNTVSLSTRVANASDISAADRTAFKNAVSRLADPNATPETVNALKREFLDQTVGDVATKERADESVKHQLALWLTYIRGIPGDNADLVNANVNKMFTMIQKDSQATVAARDYLTTQNPLTFAKAGITRTIIKVEVSKVGDLAYRIAWQERTSKRGSPDPYQAFSGTVQLAQPPAVPADPVIGQENPAGIYIKSYDLPWSTL